MTLDIKGHVHALSINKKIVRLFCVSETGGEGVKLSGDGMPTGGEGGQTIWRWYADRGRGGSNILKILTTPFMDGPMAALSGYTTLTYS